MARHLMQLEPLVLAVILYHFWTTSLPDRAEALVLLIPFFLIRLVGYGRLWTPTWLDVTYIAFLALGLYNLYAAPFSFGPAILGRPLLGFALVIVFVEQARRRGSMDDMLAVTWRLGVLVAFLALVSTQWNSKSDSLRFIIDELPTIQGFPGAEFGFNGNEIGGAMAYLAPFLAGITIYLWRFGGVVSRRGCTLAFALLMLALFLGQSRLSIIGVIVALAGVIFLLIPHSVWRYLALLGLVVFTLLQINVTFNQVETQPDRDASSASSRLEIFIRAGEAIRDYPLTGVGMNTFRLREVRQIYPVAAFQTRVLPHAHNELLQMGVDLGIPGMLIFIVWHGGFAYMIWRVWRSGDDKARTVAVAAGAGLVAHGVFGLGDAIALWDRFAFLFWWLVAILTAQYILTTRTVTVPEPARQPVTRPANEPVEAAV